MGKAIMGMKTGRGRVRRAAFLLGCALSARPSVTEAQDRYGRLVEDLLASWRHADVVCLGEAHGRAYDSELRIALVRHPDFPGTVGVIVVEWANPVHQGLLDRFILDGATMTRENLAPVWRDASAPEAWESPVYEAFLRAVREVNLALPRDRRVRLLGGDSPIDWSKVTRAEELVPLSHRNNNIRNIIVEQILNRQVKALAIYGTGRCAKAAGGFPGELTTRNGSERIWSVRPLESEAEVRLARMVLGLGDEPRYVVVKDSKWASVPADGLESVGEATTLGDVADAVVYHGNVPDSVVPADLSDLKAKYGAELERRRKLLGEAFELWRSKGRAGG